MDNDKAQRYTKIFLAILQEITDSVYVKDLEGRFEMVSKAKADRHN